MLRVAEERGLSQLTAARVRSETRPAKLRLPARFDHPSPALRIQSMDMAPAGQLPPTRPRLGPLPLCQLGPSTPASLRVPKASLLGLCWNTSTFRVSDRRDSRRPLTVSTPRMVAEPEDTLP